MFNIEFLISVSVYWIIVPQTDLSCPLTCCKKKQKVYKILGCIVSSVSILSYDLQES